MIDTNGQFRYSTIHAISTLLEREGGREGYGGRKGGRREEGRREGGREGGGRDMGWEREERRREGGREGERKEG